MIIDLLNFFSKVTEFNFLCSPWFFMLHLKTLSPRNNKYNNKKFIPLIAQPNEIWNCYFKIFFGVFYLYICKNAFWKRSEKSEISWNANCYNLVIWTKRNYYYFTCWILEEASLNTNHMIQEPIKNKIS